MNSIDELEGKSIKDKRGGDNNIHSWDIEMKGSVSPTQRQLLNTMLKERRKKKWAEEYGIDWMDGILYEKYRDNIEGVVYDPLQIALRLLKKEYDYE